MTTHSPAGFAWLPDKRIASGDRILIATDICTYQSRYYDWSPEQTWFRVGALDLRSHAMGFYRFGADDARSILRAGVPAPPWSAPLPYEIAFVRQPHPQGDEKGRFLQVATLFDADPEAVALAGDARKAFATRGHVPNSSCGMWNEWAQRAAWERAVEHAALAMPDWFSAGDITQRIGATTPPTRVLRLLAATDRLETKGKRAGTRYRVIPAKTLDRADWNS